MTPEVEIPYGQYWSTPFCKWQGAFQHLHSLEFAVFVAKQELARRRLPLELLDYAVLGTTIPQHHSFYGLPWLTGLLGVPALTGPTLSQACATSARCVAAATQEIQSGAASAALIVTCDRTSNGPHLYYPAPHRPGGTGEHEDWVMDNFGCDPLAGHSMLATAENVAREYAISTAEQHDVVLRRHEQYENALEDDRAFQRRFMTLPFEVPDPRFRRTTATLEGDEGVYPSTAEKLEALEPVLADGSVTFAAQTHPADGNAGLVVAAPDVARRMSADENIVCRIAGFGQARVDLAHMPKATVPAAQCALEHSGIGLDQLKAINSHNPFALNDIVFSRETGADLSRMNNYGCSLVWGHPQGPTGLRAIIELIEELVLVGGGYGLFYGCAAGDSAMAVVLEVSDRR